MKFSVSFASVALLILALPLLWVRPGRARPNRAQSSGAQSPIKTIYPTFTTIDVPGAAITEILGANARGDVVGIYARSNNLAGDRGFFIHGGRHIPVNYPDAYATFPSGINDAGEIVGSVEFQHGYLVKGFTYDGIRFRLFHRGSGGTTIACGINGLGTIVGGFGTLDLRIGYMERGGRYTSIRFPGNNSYDTTTGVNDLGQIVGDTYPELNSYLYVNGQSLNIDVPGASNETSSGGINNQGIISGDYFRAPSEHGFVLFEGRYATFDYPGATETYVSAISNRGQVVGHYTTPDDICHGYITSPITPADFQ